MWWHWQWLALVGIALPCAVIIARRLRAHRALSRAGAALVAAAGLLLAITGAAAWDGRQRRQRAADADFLAQVPVRHAAGGYTSSDACLACHPQQHDSWHRSYHRTMTQYATTSTVKAPLDGPPLPLLGGQLTPRRRGAEVWVSHQQGSGAGAQQRDHRIGLVTGSHHLQVYWLRDRAGGNTQQLLPYAYIIEAGRWAPVKDTFLADPRIEWKFEVWNTQCLQCHVTAGQPRPDRAPGAMDSRVAELGVGCESCHGPGQAHVEANRNPLRRYLTRLRGDGDPTVVNPARLPQRAQIDVCGQCHGVSATEEYARFLREGFSYRPGGELAPRRQLLVPGNPVADRHLAALEESEPGFFHNHFWPDGMVRTTGREASGTVRSPCHAGGKLTCQSCHSPHDYIDPDDQLTAAGASDQACLGCHGQLRERLAAHTHHRAGSPGSRCYNCHMPHTTFGLLKAVRSHEIDSPSVATSLRTGRPNACSLCHLDRSLGWTADHLTAWYRQPAPALGDEQRALSAAALHALRGDAVQRALIAWSMGWAPARAASGDEWLPAYLTLALSDPYAVIRYLAQRSLRASAEMADIDYDFVATPAALEASVQAVVARWGRTRRPVDPEKAARLLMRPGGALDTDQVSAQLDRRDNRPVELKE